MEKVTFSLQPLKACRWITQTSLCCGCQVGAVRGHKTWCGKMPLAAPACGASCYPLQRASPPGSSILRGCWEGEIEGAEEMKAGRQKEVEGVNWRKKQTAAWRWSFAGVSACLARQALGRGRYSNAEELCRLQASEGMVWGLSYTSHNCRRYLCCALLQNRGLGAPACHPACPMPLSPRRKSWR